MTTPGRWLLLLAAVLALAGLLVWSVLTNPQWRTFDASLFLHSLSSVDWGWASLALAAVYATYLVRALRWRSLMTPVKPHARLWNLFSATVIGFAALGVFGRAGEMVRPYLVARKEAVPVSSQVGVWVVERSFDTLTLLVTSGFALAQLDPAALGSSPVLGRVLHLGGSAIAFTTLAVVALLVGLRNLAEPATGWLLRRLQFLSPARRTWVERTLATFVDGSRGLRSLRTLFACSLYSLAEWILIALCYGAVFNSFSGGLRLSLSQLLIFMGAVMAGSMVQIPGIGGGIQAASLLVLTELFAVQPETAAGIALLVWVFTFLAVVPPAIPLILYEGLSWRQLRRLDLEG
jgi:uncharacterized protein (TIRG00374 family)